MSEDVETTPETPQETTGEATPPPDATEPEKKTEAAE